MRIHWQDAGAGEYGTIAQFRKDFPGAEIVTVNGRVYRGECCRCGELILGDDRYWENDLKELLCEECR